MSNSLSTTSNQGLSFLTNQQLEKYVEADKAVSELLVAQSTGKLTGIQLTVAKVTVVEMIEKVLDEAFMARVMTLQNKPYGFKTDCDLKKNPPEKYPVNVVKDCVIQAILHGAEITGNEFNILGGNAYFTKEYCENYLIKNKIHFKLLISFSKKTPDNVWIVPVKVSWIDPRDSSNTWKTENIDIPVNKFEKTKEDTLRGQAKRDAMAWLISTIRETPIPMGNVDQSVVINTEYEEIKETSKPQPSAPVQEESSTVQESTPVKESSTTSQEQVSIQMVSPEQQADFDKFISNREKYKDFDGLKKRAGIWCAEKEVKSEQLDMTVFKKIRDELTLGK